MLRDYVVFVVEPGKRHDAQPIGGGWYVHNAANEDHAVEIVLKTCGCEPTVYAVAEATVIDRRRRQ